MKPSVNYQIIIAYKTSARQTVSPVLDTIAGLWIKKWSPQSYSSTATELFNTLPTHTPTLPKSTALRHPYQGGEILTTMLCLSSSSLKPECLHRQKVHTIAQAQSLVDDFIHFYHFERFQLTYHLTPLKKRSQTDSFSCILRVAFFSSVYFSWGGTLCKVLSSFPMREGFLKKC